MKSLKNVALYAAVGLVLTASGTTVSATDVEANSFATRGGRSVARAEGVGAGVSRASASSSDFGNSVARSRAIGDADSLATSLAKGGSSRADSRAQGVRGGFAESTANSATINGVANSSDRATARGFQSTAFSRTDAISDHAEAVGRGQARAVSQSGSRAHAENVVHSEATDLGFSRAIGSARSTALHGGSARSSSSSTAVGLGRSVSSRVRANATAEFGGRSSSFATGEDFGN